jgi:redox-sensitive bicupin YhaK (pirin superfamily)
MNSTPEAQPNNSSNLVDMVIIPRAGDIGNFEIHRALPFKDKRMVGPFIFWDQMGPGEFLAGQGVDVRPHPHIGLSTVTYLFEGTMDHKDSLGNDMRIKPGELNLMTAGSGIVHSERTGMDIREKPSKLFGIQSWLALPIDYEETDPSFLHKDEHELPTFEDRGVKGRVILGDYEGIISPVKTLWDTVYVELMVGAGHSVPVPRLSEERALYVLGGQIEIEGIIYEPGQMLILHPGDNVTLKALQNVRVLILGGAAMDGPRHIWWNFVSSNKERIEKAKEDWQEGRFASVPGDDKEFIPLP